MMIKILLVLMHKAIMRWYKKHPEGAIDPEGSSYYGSAYFAIDEDSEIRARITLQASNGHFTEITAPIHGKKVSL